MNILKVVDLGCVGADFQQPAGLIADYLVGDEPPGASQNHQDLCSIAAVCAVFARWIENYWNGP